MNIIINCNALKTGYFLHQKSNKNKNIKNKNIQVILISILSVSYNETRTP